MSPIILFICWRSFLVFSEDQNRHRSLTIKCTLMLTLWLLSLSKFYQTIVRKIVMFYTGGLRPLISTSKYTNYASFFSYLPLVPLNSCLDHFSLKKCDEMSNNDIIFDDVTYTWSMKFIISCDKIHHSNANDWWNNVLKTVSHYNKYIFFYL